MQVYRDCASPSSAATPTRLRSPMCCLRPATSDDDAAISSPEARAPRSPYSWLKSTAHDLEIRSRCRRVRARIRGSCCRNRVCDNYYHRQPHQQHHRHHASLDFTYDPLSYALNFESDARAEGDDGCYPSFTARLPVSPEREVPTRLNLRVW